MTRKDRLESLSYIVAMWDSLSRLSSLVACKREGQARKPVLHNRDVGQPFQAVHCPVNRENRLESLSYIAGMWDSLSRLSTAL